MLDADYRAEHYRPVKEELAATWLVPPWPTHAGTNVSWKDTDVFPPPWMGIDSDAAEDVDLVMVTSEWPPHIGTAIAEYIRRGIPVLHLADGIVEWRQIWENPAMWTSAPVYQPVLAHKIACLGRGQARVLESWGNVGKCEVTGSPRFDHLLGHTPRTRLPHEPFRILICTAQTPGFTDQQRSLLSRGISDVKTWIESDSDQRFEAVWRLAPVIADELGIENDSSYGSLADALDHVDAVISTPSTVLLEGMLQGVPAIALDYTNSPQFVRAAWVISSRDHIEPILRDLEKPSTNRMLFQDFVLHDELECLTPAAPRVAELAMAMIRAGRLCRSRKVQLELPTRILNDPQNGHHLPEKRHDLRNLYPGRPDFDHQVPVLQSEILQLRRLLKMERDRYGSWARWQFGNQLLVGLRTAARDLFQRLFRHRKN